MHVYSRDPSLSLGMLSQAASLRIHFQIDGHLRAVIELAHSFRVTLAAVELCIDFVVDVGRERRKAVSAVRADNVSLYRTSAGIGQVDDCIRQRVAVTVHHLAAD